MAYATADGAATTADGDYQPNSGTVTFGAGETEKTIRILVNGDVRYEGTEKFQVKLFEPVNGSLGQASADGTILDDDPLPTLSIADVRFSEPRQGLTAALFTVTLSAASGLPVQVDYVASGRTATPGSDFVAASGVLRFEPGETQKTIAVDILADALAERTEAFGVELSGPLGAKLKRRLAIGTIQDATPAPLAPQTGGSRSSRR